jgi:hypothetical protein
MPSLASCTKGLAVLIAASLLGACAMQHDYLSDMYQSDYGAGARHLPHFDASADPDPLAITNGLYTQRPLQGPCVFCSSQSRFNWAGPSP